MKNWMSSAAVLDFAIGEEENAVEFYTELAEKTSHKYMKEVFLQFAGEEKGHRAKLIALKEGKKFQPEESDVVDLKISDYTVDLRTDSVQNYEDALVVAMKKEKAAFKLYTRLSGMIDSPEISQLFKTLAMEEAKHKLRFEIEYDDMLKEN
jgi:rubrerythrin